MRMGSEAFKDCKDDYCFDYMQSKEEEGGRRIDK